MFLKTVIIHAAIYNVRKVCCSNFVWEFIGFIDIYLLCHSFYLNFHCSCHFAGITDMSQNLQQVTF